MLASVLVSCGGDAALPLDAPAGDAAPPDAGLRLDGAHVAPTVIATVPVDGASEIERGVTLAATFSEDMAAESLDATTFVVTLDGEPVAGTVSYDAAARVATFRPDDELVLLGTYAAMITPGATSAAGVPLDAPRTWRFTVRDGRWSTPERIDTGDGRVRDPELASAPSGEAVAVWRQGDPTADEAGTIWSSRFVPDAGWEPATPIPPEASHHGRPDVVVDAEGRATAIWSQDHADGSEVWASRSAPGHGWAPATLLDADGRDPQASVSGDGAVFAWWTTSSTVRYSRHDDGGWQAPASLPGDVRIADVGAAVDAQGRSMIVWSYGPDVAAGLWARRLVPGAGWEGATTVSTGARVRAPALAVDRDGKAIAAWVQAEGTGEAIWANRYVAGLGWDIAVRIAETASAAQVVVDDAGRATVIWKQLDGSSEDLRSSRFVPGLGWEPPTRIGRHVRDARIAVDPAGTVLVVWQRADSDVRARRFVPGFGWGAATELARVPGGAPRVTVNAGGAAVVVWTDAEGHLVASTFR